MCVWKSISDKNATRFTVGKQYLQLFKKDQIPSGLQCSLVLKWDWFCLWHEASFAQETSSNIWGYLCGLLLNWRRLKAVLVFWRVWEREIWVCILSWHWGVLDPVYLKGLFLFLILQKHRDSLCPWDSKLSATSYRKNAELKYVLGLTFFLTVSVCLCCNPWTLNLYFPYYTEEIAWLSLHRGCRIQQGFSKRVVSVEFVNKDYAFLYLNGQLEAMLLCVLELARGTGRVSLSSKHAWFVCQKRCPMDIEELTMKCLSFCNLSLASCRYLQVDLNGIFFWTSLKQCSQWSSLRG